MRIFPMLYSRLFVICSGFSNEIIQFKRKTLLVRIGEDGRKKYFSLFKTFLFKKLKIVSDIKFTSGEVLGS